MKVHLFTCFTVFVIHSLFSARVNSVVILTDTCKVNMKVIKHGLCLVNFKMEKDRWQYAIKPGYSI